MNPLLLAKAMPALKALGTILFGILMQLLTGRFLKRLVLAPFEWLVRKTRTKKDDQLLKDAKQDLGVQD